MIVRREITFRARHSHHGMLFEPPHEHDFRVILSMVGEPNEEGFICDFRAVKRIFQRVVKQELENSDLDQRFSYPTSENLAQWIWEQLDPFFPLYCVEVKEKAHSGAQYFGKTVPAASFSSEALH